MTSLTEKQQMIVVCEGMLQLLEPKELILMMAEISRRIAESKVKPEKPIAPKKALGGSREIAVNGRTFKSTAAACKFYDMNPNEVRKLLRDNVDPFDIFPKDAPTSIRRMDDQGNIH